MEASHRLRLEMPTEVPGGQYGFGDRRQIGSERGSRFGSALSHCRSLRRLRMLPKTEGR